MVAGIEKEEVDSWLATALAETFTGGRPLVVAVGISAVDAGSSEELWLALLESTAREMDGSNGMQIEDTRKVKGMRCMAGECLAWWMSGKNYCYLNF